MPEVSPASMELVGPAKDNFLKEVKSWAQRSCGGHVLKTFPDPVGKASSTRNIQGQEKLIHAVRGPKDNAGVRLQISTKLIDAFRTTKP